MLSFITSTPIQLQSHRAPTRIHRHDASPLHRSQWRRILRSTQQQSKRGRRNRSKLIITSTSTSYTSPEPARTAPPLVIGLNQYSHDTSICILNEETGDILYAISKERLSRKKHDGGEAHTIIQHGIQTISETLNVPIEQLKRNIRIIVANNHHFRIGPFERRLDYQISLGYIPESYRSAWNLLSMKKLEISHHLAHAFSSLYHAPFKNGLIVVMDGMGDGLNDWLKFQNIDELYYTEISNNIRFILKQDDPSLFQQFPRHFQQGVTYREAESVYRFHVHEGEGEGEGDGRIELERVFKRWTAENEPPELMNHSFEEMDSIGALYSRISSIIFKDWNNCGKVMGLAPYGEHHNHNKDKKKRSFIHGELFDGSIDVSIGKQKGLDYIGKTFKDIDETEDEDLLKYYEAMSYEIQNDLEDVVMNFIQSLIKQTKLNNIIFTGGVAQNSSLNSKIQDNPLINQLYISAYPGDEGISIGCSYFGQLLLSCNRKNQNTIKRFEMPFYSKQYNRNDILQCIQVYKPWIDIFEYADDDEVCMECSRLLIDEQKVIAWFYGPSEFGARALGHRSILCHVESKTDTDFINKEIKKRESFRPLAPAILREDYADVFEGRDDNCAIMGVTRTRKRRNDIKMDAVTHIDDTARVQVVDNGGGNDTFYKLLTCMKRKSTNGIGMVLNTSLNVAGEPIVESPLDAIKTLLSCDGLHALVFADHHMVIRKKRDEIDMERNEEVVSACEMFESTSVENSYGESVRVSVRLLRKGVDKSGCGGGESEEEGEEESVEMVDGLELQILEMIHNNNNENNNNNDNNNNNNKENKEDEKIRVADIVDHFCHTDDSEEDEYGPQKNDVYERIQLLYDHGLIYTVSHTN